MVTSLKLVAQSSQLKAYLLYNSTINCSLIFSGTLSLSGYVMNVPWNSVSFQSSQLNFAFFPRIGLVTDVLPLLFSFKPTISPGLKEKDGTLTTSPFTVMCL